MQFQFAVRLLSQRDFAEAATAFREVLTIDPRLAPAHSNLGVALKGLGRLDDAAQAYRRALALDPCYAPAQHNLGEVLQAQGDHEQARRCFESALRYEPHLHQARLNLGNLLCDLGELDAAIVHYRMLVAANWNLPATYASLGTALNDAKRWDESLLYFQAAAHIDPGSAEAWFNLGKAQLRRGQPDLSLVSLQQSIAIRPGFRPALELLGAAHWCQGNQAVALEYSRQTIACGESDLEIHYALGKQLLTSGQNAQAIACFQQVLGIQSNHPTASHFLAALQGMNPAHPATGYVRQIFDEIAQTFDRQLVDTLRYTVPGDLIRLATSHATCAPPWDVLDLGCGTGLVGSAVAPMKRQLVGIDLSPKMLDQARALRIYDRLDCKDIVAGLEAEAAAGYDLITAADVFIYVGKLDTIVRYAKCVLRPRGLFAFSVEAADPSAPVTPVDDQGYSLRLTGRYIHTLRYLESLAADNGFRVLSLERSRLRIEHSKAVDGWLIVWQA